MAAVSAHAATCPTALASAYVGLTCTVGQLEFSNIVIAPNPQGSGFISPITVSPFLGGVENGLTLSFNANTGILGGSTDIAWTYNVRTLDGPIIDAFLAMTGDAILPPSSISVSEVLSNGVTLALHAAGTTTAFFDPILGLSVFKDQFNFAGVGGLATTSTLTNGFSVVPIPGAALLMGSALGFAGFGAWRRRRREASPALA